MLCTSKFQRSFDEATLQQGYRKIRYVDPDNGADIIELGIPFSDPTAEGPVIQEANVRALMIS